MRGLFLLSLLTFGAAAPAVAQSSGAQPGLERRVGRLEQEMRAVQRRVFPGGPGATVDPELQPTISQPQQIGASGDAISTLASRIEAVEAQLARVTGQVEENGYRVRQLEEQMRQLRSDLETRIARLEQAAAPPQQPQAQPETRPEPTAETPQETAATTPASGTGARPLDAAQAGYNEGYRLWEQRRFAEAAAALTAVAQRHPNSRWASWARNLAGRAHLDDNKPANAARIFLENYQANPRGERAADSLFFLGEALVKLNRRSEACPVYDELQATYPNMRAFLRERLPAARQAARCS
ncbi:MAG TPA: YbgF trimerization domain-containing protein [Allosphingosinicella sp.]|nr:YbgF trimerization domain-containing protein [Allosphingosinicella sp.]